MKNFIKQLFISVTRVSLAVIVVTVVMTFSVLNAKPVQIGVSYDKVNQIYRELVRVSGEADVFPSLQIIRSDDINAYSYYDSLTETSGIVILTGLLDTVKSEDQIALILAHEMAHYTLGHIYKGSPTKDEIRQMELQADKYGAFLMLKAKYDICEGREFFTWLNNLTGDYANADHPSNAYRYDQLNVNCGG